MRKQAYYRARKANAVAATLMQISEGHGGRRHIEEVFTDFVEMAALAVSNKFDLAQYEPREARYMEIVKRYTREEANLFGKAFGELQLLQTRPSDGDVMGELFTLFELHGKRWGQFFTPYHMSHMMASLLFSKEEAEEKAKEHGFVAFLDPCCGAGGMIIANAHVYEDAGINWTSGLHATLIDIDRRCVHMAYLQCSLTGIPAIVSVGNSLGKPENITEHWFTPSHVLGGWNGRLMAGHLVDKHSAWWTASPAEQRIMFIRQHELDLAHALRPTPDPSIAAAKEDELGQAAD